MKILFISLLSGLGNQTGFEGMSGGDRIHINLIKKTSNKINYHILTTPNGRRLYEANDINVKFIEYNFIEKKIFNYDLLRIYLNSIFLNKKIISLIEDTDYNYIINSSDFLPDFYPAYSLAKKYRSKLIFSFFLKAAHPFSSNNPYKGLRKIFGLFYYLIQIRIVSLVNNKFSKDNIKILLASDSAFIYFKKNNFEKLVIYGGINKVNETPKKLSNKFEYDAVFVGRLHDQKGVVELIKIWKQIILLRPSSKIAIIGNGPHESKIKNLSKILNIAESIKFFGFLDGKQKNDIFDKSKVFLHPPIYDTGGMALAEGMSVGLPGILFDLDGYKYCYKFGIIKIPKNNFKAFAIEFVNLINDDNFYENLSKKALDNSKNWLWGKVVAGYIDFLKR